MRIISLMLAMAAAAEALSASPEQPKHSFQDGQQRHSRLLAVSADFSSMYSDGMATEHTEKRRLQNQGLTALSDIFPQEPTFSPTTIEPTVTAPVTQAPTTVTPTTDNPTVEPTLAPTTATPTTSIPTSSAPSTDAPTFDPTATPTTEPSFRPTPAPGDPTLTPTVEPTLVPTVVPTVAPSFDLSLFDQTVLFQNFTVAKDDFLSEVQSEVFSTFNFRSSNIEGTCDDWTAFTVNDLELPFDTAAFSFVEVSFGVEDLDSNEVTLDYANCSDEVVVNRLIDALTELGDDEITCNGRSWRVYNSTCNGPVLCVDCDIDCTEASCPGERLSSINPCVEGCSAEDKASFGVIRFGFEEVVLYPLFEEELVVSPAQTSLDVTFNISRAGVVFCAAFSEFSSVEVTATSIIRQNGNSRVVSDSSVLGTITLEDLAPNTNHTVYCVTSDFNENFMSLELALDTATLAATVGFPSIEFETANDLELTESDAEEFNYEIVLDAVVRELTVINITVEQNLSCSINSNAVEELPQAEPEQLVFAAGSEDVSGRFRLSGVTVGCFILSAEAVSGDAYTGDQISVSIVDDESTIRPPRVESAEFSRDGRKISVILDSKSDRGEEVIDDFDASFTCSSILDVGVFPDGADSQCVWIRLDLLQITLGDGAVSVPGDTIALLPNVFKAACNRDASVCATYLFATTFLESTLDSPANALAPRVRLSAPPRAAECDDLEIDPTNTVGQNGRDWASIDWTVSSSDLLSEQVDAIEEYLLENYNDTTEVVVIPESLLVEGTITVRLTVEHFLGSASGFERTIRIVDVLSAPTLRISGSTDWFRWQTIRLEAVASRSSCSDNDDEAFEYVWEIYEGLSLTSIVSESSDPTILRLDPFTLDTTQYFAVVTVTAGSFSARASKLINVGSSGVLAQIAGGNVQTISVATSNTLDASGSTDIDFPVAGVLSFSWQCVEISPNFGEDCSLFDGVFDDAEEETLTLPALSSSISEDTSYNITVRVTNENGFTDSASATFNLISSIVPVVLFDDIEEVYSTNARATLNVTVELESAENVIFAQWSGVDFDLAAVALTPLKTTFDQVGLSIYQLSIAPNSLTDGLQYTLRFSADFTSSGNFELVHEVTILANGPPVGGRLRISPRTGTEFSTVYRFESSRWSDDIGDYPLLYSIATYDTTIEEQTFILNPGEATFVSLTLGRGLEGNDFAVFGVSYAEDTFGASASVESDTQVLADSLSNVVNGAGTSLSTQRANRNANSFSRTASNAASSLSKRNCTAAPDCEALNREECDKVANTCGECLDGFLGLSGASNVPCNSSDQVFGIGAACNSNLQCITGNCTLGICADIAKSCNDDCSGQGDCLFFDLNGEALTDTCLTNDAGCIARCECDDGFFGNDCSYTEEEFNLQQSLIEDICDGLADLGSLQDVNKAVIITRAKTIVDLFSDLDLISDEALVQCGDYIVETASNFLELAGDDETFPPVVDALSAILDFQTAASTSRRRRLQESGVDLFSNVTGAFTAAAQGRQLSIAINEDPTEIVTDSLSISISKTSVGFAASLEFTVPQSDTAIANGDGTTTIQIQVDTNLTSEFIGVTLIQFNGNPRGVLANSSSVETQIFFFNNESTHNVNQTIALQNRESVDYSVSRDAEEVEITCIPSFNSYEESGTCEDGTEFTVTCPGSLAFGTIVVTCPVNFNEPVCQSFDGEGFVEDEDCEVIGFTSDTTTCLCTTTGSASRRLASADTVDQLICTEFASSLSVTSTSLESSNAIGRPDFEPSNHDELVEIVCGCVLAIMLFLLVWVAWMDYSGSSSSSAVGHSKRQMRTFRSFFATLLPPELQNQSSFAAFIERLKVEYLLSWYTSDKFRGKSTVTDRWLVAICKVLNYLFFNVILAYGLYSDDEECQDRFDKHSCEGVHTTNAITSVCVWDEAKNSCTYGDSNRSFLSIICIALIIGCIIVPMDKMVRTLVSHAKEAFLSLLGQNTILRGKYGKYDSIDLSDELHQVQNSSSIMMRAAGVTQMLEKLDFVTVDEEIDTLTTQLANPYESNSNRALERNFQESKGWSTITSENLLQLKSELVTSRANAHDILYYLNQIDDDHERDTFMAKSFLISTLPDGKYVVADQMMFQEERIEQARKQRGSVFHYLAMIFLPIYMIIFLVTTFYYGAAVGRKAAVVWAISLTVALVEDFLLLQPLMVWIRSVSIPTIAKKEFLAAYYAFTTRARTLLTRRRNVMGGKDSVIQIFNPVCRASRFASHLASSRMLVTLSDYDLPIKQMAALPDADRSDVVGIFVAVKEKLLLFLLSLPQWLHLMIMEMSILIVFNMFLIACYFASTVSAGLVAVLVIIVAALILVVAWLIVKSRMDDHFADADIRFSVRDAINGPGSQRATVRYENMEGFEKGHRFDEENPLNGGKAQGSISSEYDELTKKDNEDGEVPEHINCAVEGDITIEFVPSGEVTPSKGSNQTSSKQMSAAEKKLLLMKAINWRKKAIQRETEVPGTSSGPIRSINWSQHERAKKKQWDELTHSSQFQQAIRSRVAEARRRSMLGARSLPTLPSANVGYEEMEASAPEVEVRANLDGDTDANLGSSEPRPVTNDLDDPSQLGDPPDSSGGEGRIASRRLAAKQPDSDDDDDDDDD